MSRQNKAFIVVNGDEVYAVPEEICKKYTLDDGQSKEVVDAINNNEVTQDEDDVSGQCFEQYNNTGMGSYTQYYFTDDPNTGMPVRKSIKFYRGVR